MENWTTTTKMLTKKMMMKKKMKMMKISKLLKDVNQCYWISHRSAKERNETLVGLNWVVVECDEDNI
jgi:hypothetical protein